MKKGVRRFANAPFHFVHADPVNTSGHYLISDP